MARKANVKLEAHLVKHGLRVEGDETTAELTEAHGWLHPEQGAALRAFRLPSMAEVEEYEEVPA